MMAVAFRSGRLPGPLFFGPCLRRKARNNRGGTFAVGIKNTPAHGRGFSKSRGNDLSTTVAEFRYPELDPGDQ
jgi:hypothetical protein